MVNWPCVLKLDGDDELVYLGSEADSGFAHVIDAPFYRILG